MIKTVFRKNVEQELKVLSKKPKTKLKSLRLSKLYSKKPPSDLSVLSIFDLNTYSSYESLEKFKPTLILFLVLEIIEL